MSNSFSILFYIKRSKADKSGKVNIYFRITVNGQRSELSIRRKVYIDKWNSKAGKVKGFSQEAQELNRFVDTIKNKIYNIHEKLFSENKKITAKIIKNLYLGKEDTHPFKTGTVEIIDFPELVKGAYKKAIRFSRPNKSDFNPNGFSDHLPISLTFEEV